MAKKQRPFTKKQRSRMRRQALLDARAEVAAERKHHRVHDDRRINEMLRGCEGK